MENIKLFVRLLIKGEYMPKYKIRLKQGSNTKSAEIEFKSIQHCLDFYNTLTTMQVSNIFGGTGYEDKTLPPVDDMAYYPLVKFFAVNEETRKSVQIYFQNMKLTKNENDVILKAMECLEIDGLKVDSVRSILIKNSKLNGG